MTLHPNEFIRLILLHVLPKRFNRIRHYGLFANGDRASTGPVRSVRPLSSTLGASTSPFPNSSRKMTLGAAARNQCSLAVRVRAALRHLPREADGGDAAVPAVLCAFVLLQHGRPPLPQRERLIQRIEAALGSEDEFFGRARVV